MIDDKDRAILSSFAGADGFRGIAFRIERGDGETLDVALNFDDVSNWIGAIAQTAGQAAALNPSASLLGMTESVLPISADGLRLAGGPDPNKSLLSVQIGGFALTFQIDNKRLAQGGRDLANILQTLAAERSKPS